MMSLLIQLVHLALVPLALVLRVLQLPLLVLVAMRLFPHNLLKVKTP